VNNSLKRLFGVDRKHMIGEIMGKPKDQMTLVKTKVEVDNKKRAMLVRRAYFIAFGGETNLEILQDNLKTAEFVKSKMFPKKRKLKKGS